MNKQRIGLIMLFTALAFVAFFIYWFITWQNNNILTTNLTFAGTNIPSGLDGLKILQVSDLHNKKFGKDGTDLTDKIKEAAPDIIVITGDLIDYHHTNVPTALEFIGRIVQIAPVYYVPGNHEAISGLYPELSSRLKESGVTVLDDESVRLAKGEDFITLVGVDDIFFLSRKKSEAATQAFKQTLASLHAQTQGFTILLSHRPEYFKDYAAQGFDLVFSGHAHGGQVRLPCIGGIYAPGQGLFPKYTSGMYRQGGTAMVVSRGLGNSEFPIRVFNRPEIVTVTLKSEYTP